MGASILVSAAWLAQPTRRAGNEQRGTYGSPPLPPPPRHRRKPACYATGIALWFVDRRGFARPPALQQLGGPRLSSDAEREREREHDAGQHDEEAHADHVAGDLHL